MIKLERTPLASTAPVAAGWTYYPHLTVRLAQKLFITAVILPLVLIGVIALAASRRWGDLAVLFVVPCYYFCSQSALHTEYRYVLAVDYFLFVIAAAAIHQIAVAMQQRVVNR